MSEYVKIKRKLYDELIDVKAKYVTLQDAGNNAGGLRRKQAKGE